MWHVPTFSLEIRKSWKWQSATEITLDILGNLTSHFKLSRPGNLIFGWLGEVPHSSKVSIWSSLVIYNLREMAGLSPWLENKCHLCV